MAKEVYNILRRKRTLFDQSDLTKIVRELQRDIYDEVLDFYSTQFGRVQDRTYVQRSTMLANAINKLKKDIATFIAKNDKYNAQLKNYMVKFDQIEELNYKVHKTLNGVNNKELIKAAGPQKKELIDTITDSLKGQGVDVNFIAPLKKTMYNNLLLGVPQSEAKSWLKSYIIGEGDKLGHLERYADQVTRDALNQYDGTINNMVRQQFDFNAIRYVGSLVRDSRPQCERWVNMGYIPISELDAEINWAYNYGSGMIPGTNKDNFEVYRGGYNCRHEAIPYYEPALEENAS